VNDAQAGTGASALIPPNFAFLNAR
jgi:hypothetical protein